MLAREPGGSGMIGKYGLFIVFSLLAVLACPPVLASELGEYELIATWGSLGADDGRFNRPTGIAVDAEGNVYVADYCDRIQKFDSTGAFLLQWGSSGSGDGEFYQPDNIALDADGKVYVVDYYRIQVFDSNGTFLKKWGSYGTGEEQLQYPQSIAFDADGNAYVIAGGGIKKFDSDGNFLTSWGGFGTYDGEFHNAVDVVVDAAGNVYVADCYNNRIQMFNSTGAFLLKWQVGYPYGITVDSAGDVLVAASSTSVLKFDSFGNLLARSLGGSGKDITVGADGTVYVTSDHCVRVFKQSSAPTPTPTVPKGLGITSNKDSVIRGNSFTVTITGESAKAYHLFIKPEESLADSDYPWIVAGQNGVSTVGMINPERNATVMTTAGGTRSIQFNTNRSTDAQTFTIRVEDPADPTTYDDVKVKIQEGAVTITTYGGTRYLGEEVTLYGINTDSETTYLFLTGSDLAASGVKLSDIKVAVEDGNPGTFTCVHVEADDTWSYMWNTADIGRRLNASNYTVYAAAEPRSRDNLSDAKYGATDIQLKLPSIKVTTSRATVARGDALAIDGTVTGRPDSVQIWIIGPDYLSLGVPIVLRNEYSSSNHFTYLLTGTETSNLTLGQYFVVVQHPVVNGFGVTANGTTISGPGVTPTDLAGLQPSEAANALISALESPHVDDTYAKLTFTVGAPMIRIDPIERTDKINWFGNIDLISWFDWLSTWTCGETFTITGTTCYPAGTTLAYTITSRKNGAHIFSGDIIVTDGGEWGFDVNTAAIGPGEYIVRVMSLDDQSSASASFTVRDGVVNPVPPAGATYRVERISVNPSLGDLAPGGRATLNGIINAPWAGCQEDLGFSTDLLVPAWSYAIEVEREVIRSGSQNAGSFMLSAFELDYDEEDVRVLLHLSGTVPGTGAEDPALLRIFQRDASGGTVPDSEYSLPFTPSGNDPVQPFGDNLTLSPGWNFISVPRPLAAGNDTAMIFSGINTTGRSVLRYNTTIRDWTQLDKEDRIAPLEGLWIYSAGPATVPLSFSTDPLLPPAERILPAGWNAVGPTGTTPATARDTLYSVNAQWTTLIGYDARTQAFESGIVNGGSGANADTRLVYPGKGYWLSMSGPGTLYAIGA